MLKSYKISFRNHLIYFEDFAPEWIAAK